MDHIPLSLAGGVSFYRRMPARPWAAWINIYGKQKHVGYYTSKETAIEAYTEAIRERSEQDAKGDAASAEVSNPEE